jgi:hypothetical protein
MQLYARFEGSKTAPRFAHHGIADHVAGIDRRRSERFQEA